MELMRGPVKMEKNAFRMACAALALVLGNGLFTRPAIAGDACPAGYFQSGMQKSDARKPHCIRDGATRDKLPADKAASQAVKRERDAGYTYCLLLHPGGEDC